MKGVLIDPYAQIVAEAEVDGTLQSICDLLGCSKIVQARLNNEESIILGEEAARKYNWHFIIKGMEPVYVFSGRCLAIGRNANQFVDSPSKATDVMACVVYLGPDENLQRNILAGHIKRPQIGLWEWRPNRRPRNA